MDNVDLLSNLTTIVLLILLMLRSSRKLNDTLSNLDTSLSEQDTSELEDRIIRKLQESLK